MGQQPEIPEGEFHSRLYVEPGAPQEDSNKFRARVAAYFAWELYKPLKGDVSVLGSEIRIETGCGRAAARGGNRKRYACGRQLQAQVRHRVRQLS